MTKQQCSMSSAREPVPYFPTCTKSEISAYERGWEAGNVHSRTEENPYPNDSVEAKAFEHGYLDGQKC